MICTADTSSIACHDCVHVYVLLHVYICTMNIMSLLFSFQEPVQQSIPPEPCNQSVSFQAGVSKSNMSSFSVYDDSLAEQSSFVPFHDSWVNMSKDAATHRRTSETIADKLSTCSNAGATGPRAPSSWPGEAKVYQATLGVPLEGDGVGGGGGEVSVVEQSFTQIGIRHPKIAPSISTPVGKNMKGLYQNACTLYIYVHVLSCIVHTVACLVLCHYCNCTSTSLL